MLNIISLIISAGGTAISVLAWVSQEKIADSSQIPFLLALTGWIIALAIAIILSLNLRKSETQIQDKKNQIEAKDKEIGRLSTKINLSENTIASIQEKNGELTHSVNILTKVLGMREEKEADVKAIPRGGDQND